MVYMAGIVSHDFLLVLSSNMWSITLLLYISSHNSVSNCNSYTVGSRQRATSQSSSEMTTVLHEQPGQASRGGAKWLPNDMHGTVELLTVGW